MTARHVSNATSKQRRPAAVRRPRKKTAEEMPDRISDELSRLGDGITALPDGPGKVMLLERLVASYDKLIATLKEKVEQHRAKARAAAARPAGSGRRE